MSVKVAKIIVIVSVNQNTPGKITIYIDDVNCDWQTCITVQYFMTYTPMALQL